MKKDYFFLVSLLFGFSSFLSSQYTFGTNISAPKSIATFQAHDSLQGIKIPAVKSDPVGTLGMDGSIIYSVEDSCFKMYNGRFWDCISQDTNRFWMTIGAPPAMGHKSSLLKGNPDTLIITDDGQISFGTTKPNVNSLADFHSVDSTKGIVIPRIPTSNRPAANISLGMVIYNVDDSCMQVSDGSSWKCLGEPQQNAPCVPAGFVMSYSSSISPGAEWLSCDGSAVSRVTYDDLFAVIGTIYGVGDGSTTFNLPDYRGYFMRGTDNGAGNDPDALTRTDRGDGSTGDLVGTIQLDSLKSHNHQTYRTTVDIVHPSAANPGATVLGAQFSASSVFSTTAPIVKTGYYGGNETRPKNINVDYYISSGQGCSTQSIDTIVIYDTVILDTSTSDDIGVIDAFPFATAPNGYLACEGQAVSRATYSQLFSRLGTMYGAGDGSTTFNLPDLRGQFIRGWDNGAGLDPDAATRTDRGDGTVGNNVGTKQQDAFEDHVHSARKWNQTGFDGTGGQNLVGSDTNGSSPGTSNSSVIGSPTGGNETRPTNIYMLYCIKYK